MKPYETLEILEKAQGQQKSPAGSRFGRMAYTVPPRGGTPRLEIRLERRGFGHLIPSPKMKISGKVCGKSPFIVDLPSCKMVLSHDLYLVGGDWNMAGL
jgi:hypothetical protein